MGLRIPGCNEVTFDFGSIGSIGTVILIIMNYQIIIAIELFSLLLSCKEEGTPA